MFVTKYKLVILATVYYMYKSARSRKKIYLQYTLSYNVRYCRGQRKTEKQLQLAVSFAVRERHGATSRLRLASGE